MMSLCQEICSLGSQVCMSQYEERYSVFVCIWNNWKAGKVLYVAMVFSVYCKVMYMYVDGSECDNDCKDD